MLLAASALGRRQRGLARACVAHVGVRREAHDVWVERLDGLDRRVFLGFPSLAQHEGRRAEERDVDGVAHGRDRERRHGRVELQTVEHDLRAQLGELVLVQLLCVLVFFFFFLLVVVLVLVSDTSMHVFLPLDRRDLVRVHGVDLGVVAVLPLGHEQSGRRRGRGAHGAVGFWLARGQKRNARELPEQLQQLRPARALGRVMHVVALRGRFFRVGFRLRCRACGVGSHVAAGRGREVEAAQPRAIFASARDAEHADRQRHERHDREHRHERRHRHRAQQIPEGRMPAQRISLACATHVASGSPHRLLETIRGNPGPRLKSSADARQDGGACDRARVELFAGLRRGQRLAAAGAGRRRLRARAEVQRLRHARARPANAARSQRPRASRRAAKRGRARARAAAAAPPGDAAHEKVCKAEEVAVIVALGWYLFFVFGLVLSADVGRQLVAESAHIVLHDLVVEAVVVVHGLVRLDVEVHDRDHAVERHVPERDAVLVLA